MDQIEKLKAALTEADTVIIGVGAGLSAAAGYICSGERFRKYFFDFEAKYGFHDMYSGGFTQFDSAEEKWAFWSRNIWINRYAPIPSDLYEKVYELVKDNTGIADGLSGLGAALEALGKQEIQMIYDTTHQILAQGNYVLAVSEGSFGGAATSFYDLWRVENGKVTEHWDVMETIAAKDTWQNQNGKF